MFSRLVILILLVLVPFQSFAAVGLIECQAPSAVAPVSSTGHRQSMHSHEAGTGDHVAAGTSTVVSKLDAKPDAHLSHHVHKLPCCSDAPIIFSQSLPELPGSERFFVAIAPQADDLTSVFLEGPKRPPRLTVS
jgi:hypothetical protein